LSFKQIQYNTVQVSAVVVQYSTVQCSAVQYKLIEIHTNSAHLLFIIFTIVIIFLHSQSLKWMDTGL